MRRKRARVLVLVCLTESQSGTVRKDTFDTTTTTATMDTPSGTVRELTVLRMMNSRLMRQFKVCIKDLINKYMQSIPTPFREKASKIWHLKGAAKKKPSLVTGHRIIQCVCWTWPMIRFPRFLGFQTRLWLQVLVEEQPRLLSWQGGSCVLMRYRMRCGRCERQRLNHYVHYSSKSGSVETNTLSKR